MDDVARHRHNRVEHVQDLPAGNQAVNQVSRHQAEDGAAGAGVDSVPAQKVDQQGRTQHGGNIDQQVFPFADPVLKDEPVDGQAVHVADKVRQPHMQEIAQDKPEHLAPLQRPLGHPQVTDHIIFTACQLIDSRNGVEQDQDQGHPRNGNSPVPDPDVFMLLRRPVNQIPGILPAVGADLRPFFQRHTAFLTGDDFSSVHVRLLKVKE